jgi:3'-5' exoribonuclease
MNTKKLPVFKRINELEEGEKAITFLLVDTVSIRQKSDGSDYMAVRFRDRTGFVEGRVWENVDKYRELAPGDIAKVEVEVKSYRGKPELIVLRMRLLNDQDREDGFDEKWLQQWTEHSIDELWTKLTQMVDRIESEPIRHLVHSILGAKEEVLKRVPAAKSLHHPYFGGLLEHTVNLTDACLRIMDNYRDLNRDLVIAGAVLHDIGKTEELGGQLVTDYTVPGRLTGHIVLGRDILLRHAQLIPKLPEDALRHLEHIILSHQGEKEWGAPVLPATPEALFIHLMDNLDSRMQMLCAALKEVPEGSLFSEFHHVLQRQIYAQRPQWGQKEAGE